MSQLPRSQASVAYGCLDQLRTLKSNDEESLRSSNAEVELAELISESHFSLHGSRGLCKMRALYVLSLHKVLRKGKLSYKSRLFRHHVLGSVNSIFNQIYAHLDSINPNCPKCGRVHIPFSNH